MKLKKAVALLLAATVTGSMLVSGCGSTADEGADNENGDVTNTTETETTNENASSEDASNDISDGAETQAVSLPLCEEKETIKIWMRNDVSLMNISSGDPNNTEFFKELEERTNVHVEWMIPASGSEQEQFNLLFASGDLPDMMYNQGYIDGLDAAIDDGYLLDLTPYLEEYMPNYLSVIKNSENPDVKKIVKTDSGKYGAVYTIFQTQQTPWMGWVIRQDWLDELGLDVPVTYEDYENVLKAFKEKKGCYAPLAIPSNEILEAGYGYGCFGGGLYMNGWYQDDGEAKFYFHSDPEAGRKTLTTLNSWYSQGLIDPDFATGATFGTDTVIVNNDNAGIASIIYTSPDTSLKTATDAGAKFTAILPPVENAGDPILSRMESQINGASMVISADSEKSELCMKWLDYLFSEEGSLFANYGIEGETYEMVDGKPIYNDIVTQNETYNFDEAMRYYTLGPGIPATYYDWTRELSAVPEDSIKLCDDWAAATTDKNYLYATMTAEENQEYSNIFTDLDTYVKESVISFITGEKSLDEYDDFVNTLSEYNIQKCIDLKQAALDRYNSR